MTTQTRPGKTEVECENCGDTFKVNMNATKYGVPDYCSEACGINAGN